VKSIAEIGAGAGSIGSDRTPKTKNSKAIDWRGWNEARLQEWLTGPDSLDS
jgi:hypothetical protein